MTVKVNEVREISVIYEGVEILSQAYSISKDSLFLRMELVALLIGRITNSNF